MEYFKCFENKEKELNLLQIYKIPKKDNLNWSKIYRERNFNDDL